MNMVDVSDPFVNYPFDFTLPKDLEAGEPPEARGLARDEVRLMVSYRSSNRVIHTQFRELPTYLDAGDLLVINTSGTMNAALQARRADGTACELHLSTPLPAYFETYANEALVSTPGNMHRNKYLEISANEPLTNTASVLNQNKYLWVVEVRLPNGSTTIPYYDADAGDLLLLPGGATATLQEPYTRHYFGEQEQNDPLPTLKKIPNVHEPGYSRGEASPRPDRFDEASPVHDERGKSCPDRDDHNKTCPDHFSETHPVQNNRSKTCSGHTRLWIATLQVPIPIHNYLASYGFPIRYSYVKQDWAASYYQTVYATEEGSAEMPSAGRAFTPELITRLVAQGIQIAPLILHTGVASLEEHESPYDEFYRVPGETARLINLARKVGKRVIAVGTTVVRALESVTDSEGLTHPGEGWTSLVITPQRGLRAVNAMLTGLHEPYATHLAMLEALCGLEHLKITYQEALRNRYLWHEFGDLHLILA